MASEKRDLDADILYKFADIACSGTAKVNFLTMAAEKGHLESSKKLVEKYEKGWGVPQDYDEAIKWSTVAAKLGDKRSQIVLGFYYQRRYLLAITASLM